MTRISLWRPVRPAPGWRLPKIGGRVPLSSVREMRWSLRARMLALIVLPTLAIYIAILGFLMLRLRSDVRRDVEGEMTRLASDYAARFDGAFREAAVIATTTARFMETTPGLREEQIFATLKANTLLNDTIYGAAMAFDPVAIGSGEERYCPYVCREGDGVREMFISREVYDWYSDPQWQWWHSPRNSGEASWSDPYFDEGAGNVLMVTFSAPFYRNGALHGVTTVDMMLPTLREQVGPGLSTDLDFFIVTKAGRFVLSPNVNDIMSRTIFDIAEEVRQPELARIGEMVTAGSPGVASVVGWDAPECCWVFFAPIHSTGWSFVARIPEEQALAPVQSRMTFVTASLGVTLLLIVGSIWFVSGRIVRPIVHLRSNVLRIAGGDLESRIEGVNRTDEIGELAASFNRMTEELRAHVERLANERAARNRIERDLDLAREIQAGLMPQLAPDVPGFEIAGWNQAADKTGGDFFDWLELPNGCTLITLADVTGHGIGPALIVSVCRAYFRASTSGRHQDLCEAINRVNELLFGDLPAGRFVTAVLGLIDPRRSQMQLVSAGHGPMLFYEAGTDTVHTWNADVMPLGVLPDLQCTATRVIDFAAGDVLVLVTDGFFEWLSADGDSFGIARLVEFTKSCHELPPRQFITMLYERVLQFAHESSQADDLTAIIVKRV